MPEGPAERGGEANVSARLCAALVTRRAWTAPSTAVTSSGDGRLDTGSP